MHEVERRGELLIDRGEGVWIWDEDGRRSLDTCASLWYKNVGFGRGQMSRPPRRRCASCPPSRRTAIFDADHGLAERIAAIAPVEDAVVFFSSGGAESIETAAKLARRYWSLVGEPERTVVISRERAYHGMAAYGTSIVGTDSFKVGLGTLVSDTVRVPWHSVDALADAIVEAGPGRVAAFFCEPVIGAGGVLPPPPGYLEDARRVCREAGVLFVPDEVICGYGRVRSWFASTRFGLEPDLVTFAKGSRQATCPWAA